jgi:hypothetical protein
MRIPVTLIIELTDEQVERWADDEGLERTESGKVMAKTMVENVRSYVLTEIQGLLGATGYADVTIKR